MQRLEKWYSYTFNVTAGGQYGYIPEGYRPGFDMHFSAQRTGSNETAHVKISASGGLHVEQYVNTGWHTGCFLWCIIIYLHG